MRENQRRSRARRKEYLADLEDRFRNYKERGVAATAEMQTAARRVLAENRRLRVALRARGMSDTDIDGLALETEPAGSSASPAATDLGLLLSRSRSQSEVEGDARRERDSMTPETGREQSSGLHTPSSQITPPQQQAQSQRQELTPDSAARYESLTLPAGYGRRVSGSGSTLTVPVAFPGGGSMPYPYQQPPQQGQAAYMTQADATFGGQLPGYVANTAPAASGSMQGAAVSMFGRPVSGSPVSYTGSDMDMSELLSPELQAQFQAALEESAAAVRRASDYGAGGEAQGEGGSSGEGAGEGQGQSVWEFERQWT